jgi:nucleoside diphosphate-linked moiety X motif protein 19
MTIMRKASSILVVSPYQNQLKILMLQRSEFGFYGGLLVFPGGTLAIADAAPEWNCIAPKAEDLALKICGIRETFEESGLLLAAPSDGLPTEDRQEWREKIIQDPLHFIQFARTTLRVPMTDQLHPWSNWISPSHHPKRFDTHFYLHILPKEVSMDLKEDGKETVGVHWLTPTEILDRFAKQEITLLPPQFCQVTELVGKSVDDVKEMAHGRVVEPIEPVMVDKGPEVITMRLPINRYYNGLLELQHQKGKVFGIRWKQQPSKL